jgi:cell fate (sporulation/competence/biofilm development) regulator YlbF (YheA/YmcA/DUF963 family)
VLTPTDRFVLEETAMDDILGLARQLGKQLAEHPRTQALRAAQDALSADPEAQKLLTEFNAQAEKMETLAEQQRPIEPEDKRKLAEIRQRMAGNACLGQFAKVQADYIELTRQVSAAIGDPGVDEG